MSPRSGPLLCGSPHSDRHFGPAAPRPAVHLPPTPHSLSGLLPHPDWQCWACLSPWAPASGGGQAHQAGLPRDAGVQGIGGQGPPKEAGQRPGELRPRSPVHTSPRAPTAAPSRDFLGWSRLVLGPHEARPAPRLFPYSGLLSRRPQARAGGVAARLVGPEGGSWCDQSQCVCGWCGLRVGLPGESHRAL